MNNEQTTFGSFHHQAVFTFAGELYMKVFNAQTDFNAVELSTGKLVKFALDTVVSDVRINAIIEVK